MASSHPYKGVNFFMKILFWGKNFLFPGACALCGGSLIDPLEVHYSLCNDCRFALLPAQGNKCSFCGKPLVSEIGTCLPCRNSENHSYDRLWVIFPYTGKYRDLLTAYKFKKNLSIAGFLAEKINEVLTNEPLLKDTVIVPVPPRPGKIKETGWDQVDYLVKKLKKISGNIVVKKCLKRTKSKIQKSLNRKERIENLKGRIGINGAAPKNVLIIDDVITTGSTMEVNAQVLKNAGTEKVYGLCLFYD